MPDADAAAAFAEPSRTDLTAAMTRAGITTPKTVRELAALRLTPAQVMEKHEWCKDNGKGTGVLVEELRKLGRPQSDAVAGLTEEQRERLALFKSVFPKISPTSPWLTSPALTVPTVQPIIDQFAGDPDRVREALQVLARDTARRA